MYRNFMSLPLLGESMLPHPTILPENMTRIHKCAKFILLPQKIQIYTGGRKKTDKYTTSKHKMSFCWCLKKVRILCRKNLLWGLIKKYGNERRKTNYNK